MIKISVTIITLNEERNIARCLDSLEGVADEIVIVDSFSIDKTKEICMNYAVNFIEREFDNYASQKNFAAEKCNNNYILSIDADEVLSEELKKSILEVKQKWEFDGYYFNRLNNYCGKWIRFSGWYPDRKLRLYDKRKAKWGGKDVHEELIMEQNTKICFLKGNLYHYSYNSISEHIERINKYTEIAASYNFKKKKKVYLPLIVIRFFVNFLNRFVIKLGFLDGYNGLIISILTAYGKFIKDVKLWQMNKPNFYK
ncbi:MAG: glycosyltransferase family 2 protein [Bacteroidales bacterium]|nr:glycosyltransferase family 2 protein [Bacteroidales bacterium]